LKAFSQKLILIVPSASYFLIGVYLKSNTSGAVKNSYCLFACLIYLSKEIVLDVKDVSSNYTANSFEGGSSS